MLNTKPLQKYNSKNNNLIEEKEYKADAVEVVDEKKKYDDGIHEDKKEKDSIEDIKQSFHNNETKIFSIQKTEEELIKPIYSLQKPKEKTESVGGYISEQKKDIQIMNNSKPFKIVVDEEQKRFTMYEDNNNKKGTFTIEDIIKYLGGAYDNKRKFLNKIKEDSYKESKNIIKNIIFKLNYNKKDGYSDIILIESDKSGFMDDIDSLIKLNNMLEEYIKNHLFKELSLMDNNSDRSKIEQNVKKFFFIMLNYSLKQISNKMTKTNEEKFGKYSNETIQKINLFVQDQIKIVYDQNKKLMEMLEDNKNAKCMLRDKLDKLIDKVQEQNNIINSNNNLNNTININPKDLINDIEIKERIDTGNFDINEYLEDLN